MYPSLLANEAKHALTEYLSTTFALADDEEREALEKFLQDPEHGIFRGPYLRVRTSFHDVPRGWQPPVDWLPAGFQPYQHQAKAFARLSTRDTPSRPTIVTTGTGSGKTESFLIPLLDHCARAKARGEQGIKAIILYPMNALVADQGRRIAEYLHDEPHLREVAAGVYVGGEGKRAESTRDALADNRTALRESPPDILLTNYKMLDLLLLRAEDAPLWADATANLRYLVLDEFHTYDGAQGTDVAMLLRRLGATLKVAEPGRPLGRVTPVATSATLGGETNAGELCRFAETVFGVPFDTDAVITESRRDAADIVSNVDVEMNIPDVQIINDLPEPTADDPGSWQSLAHSFLGSAIADELALGRRIARSTLTRAVLQALSEKPRTVSDAVDAIIDAGVLQWGFAKQRDPKDVEQALLRFLTLLSVAKADTGGRTRPLVNVEVQLWVRELTRMLRAVKAEPSFSWWHDGLADTDERRLPAVYCRVCGRSGWAAVLEELGEDLDGNPQRTWRANVGKDRSKVRYLLHASDDEPDVRHLDPKTLTFAEPGSSALPVLMTPTAEAAAEQRCPSCHSDDGMRFLGSSVATLISVALTQLFGSDLVTDGEKKTLVFTDSVQDAAHRAAFIEGRAFQFNLRSAMLRAVGKERRTLQEVTTALGASDADDLYAITPSDFVHRLGLSGEWLKHDPRRTRRNLLRKRLAFQTHLEIGLRSRLGRTLELTGSLGVDYDLDLPHHAALVRSVHENLPERGMILPEQRAYEVWLLGVLDRLRKRGGVAHDWLTKSGYVGRDGNRYPIWGGSPKGMPKFPRGRPAPMFFTSSTGSAFDSLTTRNDTWLTNWTERALGVSSSEARALLEPAVRTMSEGAQPPLLRFSSDSDAKIYALDPMRILLSPIGDDELDRVTFRCPQCHHVQPASPVNAAWWDGAPCPRLRCTGRLAPSPVRVENFYRSLYQSGRLRHVVTHEHTALLDDETRSSVERDFARGGSPIAPNVLTCTPTLELGIDIGDLSTVGLATLPRTPASYLQRVGRAGRSTGNALVLATVPSTPRDLYYLSEPTHLIDGEVTPPAAYLAATELLCRQYLAFCLDRVASGELRLGRDMPRLLGRLLDDGLANGTWLREFCSLVTDRAGELARQFLDLFATAIDATTRAAVDEFARAGLERTIARVVHEWAQQREEVQRRVGELSHAINDLEKQGHLDDEQAEEQRRWRGEFRALQAMLRQDSSQNALTGMARLGLLPNYNLRDDRTELDVSLWWTSDDDGGSGLHAAETTYGRPSRTALTEFAPGAVFYARGYRVEIDAVDIGPAGQAHWRTTRLCPDCGWGTEQTEPAPDACPRCHGTGVADAGAVHKVLELKRVSAVHRRDEAVIEDEAEDRTRTRFDTVVGVDVDPVSIARAWRLRDQAFGAEYVRQAFIRTINAGRSERPGADVAIAGARLSAPRFPTCRFCGVVRMVAEDRVKHRGWCSTRRGIAVEWDDLLLSHQISTQAVRLLLPLSTFRIDMRLTSAKAAILLGLRKDFGGDPQHLEVVTAQMPDEHRRPRQFLVLHDTVPGGTGYLDRFGDPDRMRRILEQAHETLSTCPCQYDGRVACHRCLLGVIGGAEVEHASRRDALKLVEDLLADWDVEEINSVGDIDISNVHLSELEQRFSEQLKRAVDTDVGQSWSGSRGMRGEELDIRLLSAETTPRRWSVRPLVQLTAGSVTTEPDFLFTRQDAQDARVAVYLDGKAFHASAKNSRTDDDARKRAALRDDGYRVWSLTWEDVDDYARLLDGYESQLPELVDGTVRNEVRAKVNDPRVTALWGNPMASLIAYLQDPSADVWADTAVTTCLSLMAAPAHRVAPPVSTVEARLVAELRAWADREQPSTTSGSIVLASCAGRSGLPIAIVGRTDGDGTDTVGLCTVLDDRDAEVGGGAHDRQWRDWLRWANLAQFLPLPAHGRAMPLRMAECWTWRSLDVFASRPVPLSLPHVSPQVDVSYPEAWKLALAYTDELLQPVVHGLATRELSVPDPGMEVGDGWPIELCWPERRLAVVIDDEPERDRWLAENGWQRLVLLEGQEEDLVGQITSALGGMS